MADTSKPQLTWPSASWKVLKRIIKAWYVAEEGGSAFTQREVAKIAGLDASRVSLNKSFLQTVGIIEPEGVALTEGGKQLGLGLTNDNERVTQQALEGIVRANTLLRQLWDVIRGRGTTEKADFEAQVVLLTKQGSGSDYFSTGVNVLESILLESGLVGMSDNSLRPNKPESRDEPKKALSNDGPKLETNIEPGLRRIPIPVSAKSVWYVLVSENPDQFEIEKFIDMQKLIFSTSK